MKLIRIYDPVHEQHFFFCFNMKIEAMEKLASKEYDTEIKLDDGAHRAMGLTFDAWNEKKGKYGIWVWIRGKAKTSDPDWMAVLVHECIHAAKTFLHNRGFDLQHPADEPMAYEVDFLIRTVLKELKRK